MIDLFYLELYTDYLISNNAFATAIGLSAMMNNEVSHDQVIRFLSSEEFDSKRLWMITKKTVREIESHETLRLGGLGVSVAKWGFAPLA